MTNIEALLQDAGERWRASQPPPAPVDIAVFGASTARWRVPAMTTVGAALAIVALLVGGLVMVGQLGRSPGVGAPGPSGETPGPSRIAANASAEGVASPSLPPSDPRCAVTMPTEPFFVPPDRFLPSPPRSHGAEWYGTDALWTTLDQYGEIWRDLPVGPSGWVQKTVWWSADWDPGAEPEPAIVVSGQRLDAPGAFEFTPGTNASAPDINTAMMVGIDIPQPGCWEVTGTYRDVSLTYVVLVSWE